MCQNQTSVQDAKGKTPLIPMGYDTSLGLLEHLQVLQDLQGRKSVERPTILRTTEEVLYVFGSGSSDLGSAVLLTPPQG